MGYYITPIIKGTGAHAAWDTEASRYGSAAAIIPTGPDGNPLFTWALVVVPDTQDQTAILADPLIDHLPITSLDQTIGSMTPQQRKTFQDLGTKYSVPAVSGLNNQSTCRDALIAFGRALSPTFDPSVFMAL